MNEEIKPNIEQNQMPEKLEMTITMFKDGAIQVKYPLLDNKLASFGLLKMAEKTLDQHYRNLDNLIVKPNNGNIIDFARRIIRGKK